MCLFYCIVHVGYTLLAPIQVSRGPSDEVREALGKHTGSDEPDRNGGN